MAWGQAAALMAMLCGGLALADEVPGWAARTLGWLAAALVVLAVVAW